VTWLDQHWLSILLWTIFVLLAFRFSRPIVHKVLVRVMNTKPPEGEDPIAYAEEVEKRINTIEGLIAKLIKVAVVAAIFVALLAAFDLFAILAGLGIVLVGLLVASQEVVLDILMGVSILLEGQYYRGDWIVVGTVEGTVEDVSIRRTVIRDSSGTVHSVSNGMIRISSNQTRVYAGLIVDITIADPADIDRAAAIINRVGAEMAADPAWEGKIYEAPTYLRVQDSTEQGVILRATGKVRGAERFTANGDLRGRILSAFGAEGIQIPSQRLMAALGAGRQPGS
jgi:small conductance mechanosensitive channel